MSDNKLSFKVVFLANKGIGVHSILSRLTGNSPDFHEQVTVQVGIPQEEKRQRNVTVGNKEYTFWFHETAGQEIFRGKVTSSYFRHAVAIIYAYDETDASTFDDIQNWMTEASRCGAGDLLCFLIGNKMDLVAAGSPRAVSEQQAQDLANLFMTNPMRVSAKTGEGCEEAFNYITQTLIKQGKGTKYANMPGEDQDEDHLPSASGGGASGKASKKKNCMC